MTSPGVGPSSPRSGAPPRARAVLLAGQIARVGLQGGYFILLARALDADNFGAVAAVLAAAAMLLPFSGLGSTLLLVKNVSRDPEAAAAQWSSTASLVVGSGVALTALLCALTPWLAGGALSWQVVLWIGLADLVCARLVEAGAILHQARERMMLTAVCPVLLGAGRLAGLVVLTGPFMPGGTLAPEQWAVVHLATSAPVALVIALGATRAAGWCPPRWSEYWQEWPAGLSFSGSQACQTAHNDVDKVLLAGMAPLASVGSYSAAYRLVDMSYIPVRTLVTASYPAMWRAGASGVRAALVVTRGLSRPVLGYAVAGTTVLALGAGAVPHVLGPSYAEAVPALRLLSLLLLLRAVHYLAADTLTVSGHNGRRVVCQVAVLGVNVVSNVVLIPVLGWQGAAVSSLLCDALLVVLLWWQVARALREEGRPAPAEEDSGLPRACREPAHALRRHGGAPARAGLRHGTGRAQPARAP